MTISIRRIRPEDALAVRDVRLRALASDPVAFGSTHAREVGFPDSLWKERAHDQATSNDRATMLAIRDEAIVGLAIAVRQEQRSDTFDIFAMWVAPEARRVGVARRLLSSLEIWMLEHGGKRAELSVTTGAPDAERVYEAAGYVRDGRDRPGTHDGIIERSMAKTLTRTSDTDSTPPAEPHPSRERA